MLWAANFADAEYIGFVDIDTVITNAVRSYGLFDEDGRLRAIAQSVKDSLGQSRPQRVEATDVLFMRKSRPVVMTYFPVVLKRKHFAMIRNGIMSKHPEYSCFDDFRCSNCPP